MAAAASPARRMSSPSCWCGTCVDKAPVRAVCIREVQRSLDWSVQRLIEDKIRALGVGFRLHWCSPTGYSQARVR